MRIIFTLSFLLLLFPVRAQFWEDFSDGEIKNDPIWFSDNLDTKIISSPTGYALQLIPRISDDNLAKGDLRTPSLEFDSIYWGIDIETNTTNSTTCIAEFVIGSTLLQFDQAISFSIHIDYINSTISFRRSNRGIPQILAIKNGCPFSHGINRTVCRIENNFGEWHVNCENNGISVWTATFTHTESVVPAMAGIRVMSNAPYNGQFTLHRINCGNKPIHNNPIKRGDLIFSEIMADPTPSVGLPEVEWVEVYNASDSILDLGNCHLISNGKIGTIESYPLAPHSHVALCSASALLELDTYAPCAVVKNMPSLTNDACELLLTNSDDEEIAILRYTHSWYNNAGFKADGGWSLERRDLKNPISSEKTWGVCCDERGGTPGAQNSIASELADTIIPHITAVGTDGRYCVTITFNKEISSDGISESVTSPNASIASVSLVEPYHEQLNIYFNSPLDSLNTTKITFSGIACVSGWIMPDTTIKVALPHTPEYMDIVINEIMPSVNGSQSKFVEILNTSQYFIDLSKLMIGFVDEGEIVSPSKFADETVLFAPNHYAVMAVNRDSLHTALGTNPNTYYINGKLSKLYAGKGNVAVATTSGTVLDQVSYSAEWHHPQLTDEHNVSLERIDPMGDSNSPHTWHSASHSSGYNTAGWQNSQSVSQSTDSLNACFSLRENSFSPDNDGFNDLLLIDYSMPEAGYLLTAHLYTRSGARLGTIYNNQLIGTVGTLHWDGILPSTATLPEPGLYIILLTATHPTNSTITQKLIFVRN